MLLVALRPQTDNDVRAVFDRQVENLLAKGYPELAGLDEDAFLDRVRPLEERLSEVSPGGLFAVVVDVPRHEAIARVELDGKGGFTRMEAADLERFAPLEGAAPPAAPYLVADVDTGAATLNVTPDAALDTILGEGRSPLTIDEGLAVVTHHPEVLRTRNCFSMLGSRCGDRRVTAMWVSGGRPRLGWCWAGNPHTWLGSASCAGRIGSRPSELAA
jgi:hypothetical protein